MQIGNKEPKAVEEREFTQEETQNQIRAFEGDILKGMLSAAKFQSTEVRTIEIARGGDVLFTFRIRPLSEDEYESCRRKATKYVRNKQLGIKMPEETNSVLYRSLLILAATVEEDRKKTWENKQLWKALEEMDRDILTGADAIDAVLMPGEKARVVDQIDLLSGFEANNLEEVIKN